MEYEYPYMAYGDKVLRTKQRTVEAQDLSPAALNMISLIHKTGSTEVSIPIPAAVCTFPLVLTPESRLSFGLQESSEKSPYIDVDILVHPNSDYVERHAAALLDRAKALLRQS